MITGTAHLLKSPFCAHPKTGFICVPIDPQAVDEFDPTSVPRLGELVAQLSSAKATAIDEQRHLLAYKHTALQPAIELFQKIVSRFAPVAMEFQETDDNVKVNIVQPITV